MALPYIHCSACEQWTTSNFIWALMIPHSNSWQAKLFVTKAIKPGNISHCAMWRPFFFAFIQVTFLISEFSTHSLLVQQYSSHFQSHSIFSHQSCHFISLSAISKTKQRVISILIRCPWFSLQVRKDCHKSSLDTVFLTLDAFYEC